MDDTEFKPFEPPVPMFRETAEQPQQPADPAPRRRGRPPKANMPPAPQHERPTRAKKNTKKKARKARVTVYAVKAASAGKPARVIGKTRGLKLDVASAMAISAMLKPTDFKIFESLTETLQTINKATRRRVLAAIARVFG